jgi:hypothetical protein
LSCRYSDMCDIRATQPFPGTVATVVLLSLSSRTYSRLTLWKTTNSMIKPSTTVITMHRGLDTLQYSLLKHDLFLLESAASCCLSAALSKSEDRMTGTSSIAAATPLGAALQLLMPFKCIPDWVAAAVEPAVVLRCCDWPCAWVRYAKASVPSSVLLINMWTIPEMLATAATVNDRAAL